jgi:MoxR-like ATPase
MQERMVSVGGRTYQLDLPYFVLATQNPRDTEGTYALPEAQVDRFLFRLQLDFPDIADLRRIGDTTTGVRDVSLQKRCDGRGVLEMQDMARRVEAPPQAEEFAIHLVLKTHPASREGSAEAKRFLRYGSSPRGVQGLILGGKVRALVEGSDAVEPRHIAQCARQVLGHRLILNFEGEAEQVRPEDLIDRAVQELTA